MASTFDVPPASLHDKDNRPTQHFSTSGQQGSTSSFDSNQLPSTLSRIDSDSLSPINYLETPESSSSLGHYPASDFSELGDDPFFGADFSANGGTPNFLEQDLTGLDQPFTPGIMPDNNVDAAGTYPLTPEQTASVNPTPPQSNLSYAIKGSAPSELPNCISPQQIQKNFNPYPINTQTSDLTPSQSSSCLSSEDGGIPTMTSPRVTVSMWGNHNETLVHSSVERGLEDSPTTVRGGFESAGDLISSGDHSSPRDSTGRWQPNSLTGQAGLDPTSRPTNEIPSINELAAGRDDDERKEVVGDWLADKMNDLSVKPDDNSRDQINELNLQRDDPTEHEIPFGRETENRFIPGQTYYRDQGEMNQQDREIVAKNRNWSDSPMFPSIIRGQPGRNQPETSAAAMERFERMYRDTDSILSRAATWGTRRRSLPSVFDLDMADGTSGGLLKKLSSSRENRSNKPGSLLRNLQGLVRRPSASQILKRTRSSGNDEESLPSSEGRGSQDSKRDSISKRGDSISHLAPPNRMGSWGKKPMPSINTAIASMGSNIASIGTAHARSGSVSNSGTPVGSITSPKSPFGGPFGGLSVKKSLRRPRSKSELPKSTSSGIKSESHPTLVSMWKRETGGPPVAALAKTKHADLEDDEDDEDDFSDEADMRTNPNVIDNITPNLEGFQQHIIDLNPDLANTNTFLVDRIAYHQVQRYKYLLKNQVSHIGLGAACLSGTMCVANSGSAILLDQNKNVRDLDPLQSPNDDDDGSPVEGAINNESFPQDIPMPPTSHLPAEFECRLCFATKKFMKPSDWTKHVHEDVQPFTCTWDKCPGPKMFKRKADWVRHENEGHRHLEWWTCDVEACHHQCFRRDNFLQHLVREHKYPEPKVKSKTAIKKAGGSEPTWQKVEQCHHETTKKPYDEPCRFCGRTFPTWKKLTVHLAKHMEQVSLPVLRLVDAKASELSADTVISPVQDPPPRNILTTPIDQTSLVMQYPLGGQQQHIPQQTHQMYQNQNQNQMTYPVMASEPYHQQQQQGFYTNQYTNVGTAGHSFPSTHAEMGLHPMNHQNFNAAPMQDMNVTGAGYQQSTNAFMMPNDGMGTYSQMNPLGLSNGMPVGQMGQMVYDGITDPSSGIGSPFSGQESISPYSHSPNLNSNTGNGMWGDGRMAGYQ
ncbi:hypothetical protein KAF25_006704 [Fusarium avenaceum]|uniref:C2H2-type domain-containing protein n=1 Tax=Fusarium avenaceum TaxID=40199 RepID=A0A9P7H8K4_9HYPO|nr:hypothetical protein KAF25_006704 [Fusarium avenaceum]